MLPRQWDVFVRCNVSCPLYDVSCLVLLSMLQKSCRVMLLSLVSLVYKMLEVVFCFRARCRFFSEVCRVFSEVCRVFSEVCLFFSKGCLVVSFQKCVFSSHKGVLSCCVVSTFERFFAFAWVVLSWFVLDYVVFLSFLVLSCLV
jgi:hypothetical protein